MATKSQTVNKKSTNQGRTILLVIGICLVIGAALVLSLLYFGKEATQKEKENNSKTPTVEEKGPTGDFDFIHEVERIVVTSKSEEYHTNLVDIKVNVNEASGEKIQYIYVSNTGFGQDEVRYTVDEQIIDWPISETQDGQEHLHYSRR